MHKYGRFLMGCQVALKCLESYDEAKVQHAYRVLEQMRAHLPVMQPESSLMYAHAMYFFAKAEQGIYFGDFNRAMSQIRETIHICLTAKKFLTHEDSQSMFWIDNLHRRCGERMREYLNNINKPKSAEKQEYVCPICGNVHPNKTGMHLVPLLLIKEFFPRFKELAIEENNAMAYTYGFVGRNLGGHIDEIRGYELTEEERELELLMSDHNPLTRDYLWCSDCEKRFTAIENKMLEVHEKQLREEEYEYKVPYLFWMSVFWRLSIGKMSIHLSEWVEKKIADMIFRAVEPDGTFHWEEVETCFSYGATQCSDVREELMGIWGTRNPQPLCMIIICNLVLTFFPTEEDEINFRKHDKVMQFNNGTKKEEWGNIPFTAFWDAHQYITYENAEYDMTHLGQSERSDVILPRNEKIEPPQDGYKIYINDYHFMKGKYPFIIPWSLREIVPKLMQNNRLKNKVLAEGTLYSADEVKFMRKQVAIRQSRLTNNLKSYYDSHPIDEKELNFAPQMYGNEHETYIQIRSGALPKKILSKGVRNLYV